VIKKMVETATAAAKNAPPAKAFGDTAVRK
jgi:hypothetical protein